MHEPSYGGWKTASLTQGWKLSSLVTLAGLILMCSNVLPGVIGNQGGMSTGCSKNTLGRDLHISACKGEYTPLSRSVYKATVDSF